VRDLGSGTMYKSKFTPYLDAFARMEEGSSEEVAWVMVQAKARRATHLQLR